MLGSHAEAEDAVQEAWLRLSRTDSGAINDLDRWLTTVVARVSLDMLRSRKTQREESLDWHVPDPVVEADDHSNPERQAEMADSVGLALLVVLETLTPAERLAFVLHDLFAVSFEEIAPLVERTPAAARQLASRARRRVQGGSVSPNADRQRQRAVVDAFVAASRGGDIKALLAVLDPNVVMRLDRGENPPGASRVLEGAEAVAGLGFRFSGDGWAADTALVNGAPGLLVVNNGHTFCVISFTLEGDLITAIDMLADPTRLSELPLPR
jgi:RNA polymerase sigma-70 factor (ECF subfamily)